MWKLKRGQRCVVNLAGVYFQSYWLILLLGVFFVTGNDILRYLILIMNLGFAMTLNPFFKFDGYWIASDLLGVPNLRQRSLELFSYMWNRLKKRPIKQLPYLLQMIPPLALFDSTENDLQQGNYLKAYNRHPEDIQLRYLYTESIRTEHPAKADSLLQNLTACYPKNSLYLLAYAWELYQQKDTAPAHEQSGYRVWYPTIRKSQHVKDFL